MEILNLESKSKKNGIILKVRVGEAEFRQLQGHISGICMFATDSIDQEAKVTKTGARHSYAKWFLVPVKLRQKYQTDEYDYDEVKCKVIEYKEDVYFVYRVKRKGIKVD